MSIFGATEKHLIHVTMMNFPIACKDYLQRGREQGAVNFTGPQCLLKQSLIR